MSFSNSKASCLNLRVALLASLDCPLSCPAPRVCSLETACRRHSAVVTSLVSFLLSSHTGSTGSVSGESHRPSKHNCPARCCPACQYVLEFQSCWCGPGWGPKHTLALGRKQIPIRWVTLQMHPIPLLHLLLSLHQTRLGARAIQMGKGT